MVLDPFLGSGTTMKVAHELGRNSWGYEIDAGLEKIIKQKMAWNHDPNMKLDFRFRKNTKKVQGSARSRMRSRPHVAIKTGVS
jgi:DNA modification methylase